MSFRMYLEVFRMYEPMRCEGDLLSYYKFLVVFN